MFIIKDKKGEEVDGAYVKLTALSGHEDSFEMLGYKFRTIFYTDYSNKIAKKKKGKTALPLILRIMSMVRNIPQAREVINPAFRIMVFRDDLFIAEKILKTGDYITFDGYRLFFEDLDYWAKFYVGMERGLGILYTGFVLMIVALVIRFLFYRKKSSYIFLDLYYNLSSFLS
ncbi:MAG: hypothetical protein L0958_03450 [Candidatus Mariimomonas ferrooxydans]